MGRSTTTTKGGKFMNPTDQARKEARKRELKKNKKQRQIVRTAVLKGKNPREIIEELEKIDDMEYNPITPCPHAPKVMFEKRRKLAETWDRVIKMYEKDAPEQFADLKKLWMNYQARKIEVVKYYESVISAQDVDVDAIPLPSAEGGFDGMNIPLPPPSVVIPQGPPKSVLKKPPSVLETTKPMLCPGVPADVPPKIEDYDVEEDPEEAGGRKRTIRFGDEGQSEEAVEATEEDGDEVAPGAPNNLQKKMLAMAGQDIDSFMKEMEEVHRSREAEKAADLQQRLARLEGDDEPQPPGLGEPGLMSEHGTTLVPPPSAAGGMYRPPPRPGVPPPGIRPPPGPPPGRPPTSLRPGQAPPGVRPPPGPPPGRSPRPPSMPRPLGVVSAKPQLTAKTDSVIASAPVMRNLRSDVTRFVPTNLRVKRQEAEPVRKVENVRKKPDNYSHSFAQQQQQQQQLLARQQQQQGKSKDDVYADFMKEMQNFM